MSPPDGIPAARPDIDVEAALEMIEAVLESGRLTMGGYVRRFETIWAALCGTKHAVAVSNGTAALHLALEALDIGAGDRVVVPPITFGATVAAVIHAGATPVFCDIDPLTYTLDPVELVRVMDVMDVDAVLPVHLYGHPADMAAINHAAAVHAHVTEHPVHVIEDAAQAHGASTGYGTAGALGDAGCFSFYATKNATTAEGGAVTTDDDALAERIRRLRSHGMTDRDTHVEAGYNYRMSELQAALGCEQVHRLTEMNALRSAISRRLLDFVADEVSWATPARPHPTVSHAYFWAPIEVGEKYDGKRVWRELKDAGLETRHRYTLPLYEQPAYADACEKPLECPVAERVSGQMIGLPNHPGLTDADVERVMDVLREFEP